MSCCMERAREFVADFVFERDSNDVLSIMRDDWNWLFTNDNPHYDPEYIMHHEIPNKELVAERYSDKLQMRVLRNNERVIGFVTFYNEDSGVGRVKLVSVTRHCDEKECGRRLVVAAVNALFDSGCTRAYLYTHKKNEKVAAYESLGFSEEQMPEATVSWFNKHGISADDYAYYSVDKTLFK